MNKAKEIEIKKTLKKKLAEEKSIYYKIRNGEKRKKQSNNIFQKCWWTRRTANEDSLLKVEKNDGLNPNDFRFFNAKKNARKGGD